MKTRGILAAVLAISLTAAVPLPTVYSAPAGLRHAGAPQASNPFNFVMPNGRIVAPIGRSVVVGMNPLGLALVPGGKFAVVSNDDERESVAVSALSPGVRGGYSLTVVNLKTMTVADSYSDKDLQLFLGVAAFADPANPARMLVMASNGGSNTVSFFTLDAAGKLHPEGTPLAMPSPSDPRYANQNHAFPGSITIAANHRIAYVVNDLANTVTSIDVTRREVLRSVDVGFFPWAAAIAHNRLFVTDRGLMRYGNLGTPVRVPSFSTPPFTPGQSSALTTVALAAGGDLSGVQSALTMDVAPDASNNVGGAHPSSIVVSKNGRYAYVAMVNVDRIAVVSLQGTPRVAGGLQLRLFDKAPYGTQPDAMTMSPDGKRLYVALAGLNAVAVLDARNPLKLHRLGLIPTGWYPSALAVSGNGRYLYVANAKGIGHEPRFQGGPPYRTSPTGHIYQNEQDSNEIWGTLQRIDLRKLPLEKTTYSALRYNRATSRGVANDVVPPLRSLIRSGPIKHVVLILEENKSYDSMLGDLTDAQGRPYGDGDPALTSFGESITPNLHALAREFALATNFYADSEESDAGHQFVAGGITTAYSEKTLLVKSGRSPLVNKNEDPEDYPRAGYIFNNAARAGLSYRDYGDLVRISGYDEGRNPAAKADDPYFVDMADQNAPTNGLGGLYSLDVPALAALSGHVDVNYPGWNLRIRDVRRAKEFIRDFGAYRAQNGMPDFTYIWLPSDHGGAGADIPPLPEEVADGDRALGMIVDYLTHQPEWPSTAIFITPDDAQSSRDHVYDHRSYAVVVSPYAKRHFTGTTHLSTVSVLKTEEELLGLPPLSLGDLLASDFTPFFTATPDTATFSMLPVATQTASAEGRRIAALLEQTDQSGPDADVERSARIIDYARRADNLAARRQSMSASAYARAQHALYSAALDALHSSGN